jgi:hypothetical protein
MVSIHRHMTASEDRDYALEQFAEAEKYVEVRGPKWLLHEVRPGWAWFASAGVHLVRTWEYAPNRELVNVWESQINGHAIVDWVAVGDFDLAYRIWSQKPFDLDDVIEIHNSEEALADTIERNLDARVARLQEAGA